MDAEALKQMDAEDLKPLQQDTGDTKSTAVYLKQDPEFWEKFSDLANADPEGLGELLGVDANQVAAWYGKIRQVSHTADQTKAEKETDSMLPTGDDNFDDLE